MLRTSIAPSWFEVARVFGDRSGWGYRGHANASWPLETGLFRESRRYFAAGDAMLHERESWLLRQFGRYAHQFRENLPAPGESLEWLALIQHYGGPTRLLDFTHSLFIAAFFALESATQDSAIWAVNLGALRHAGERRLGFTAAGRVDEIQRTHNARFQAMYDARASDLAVLQVEPERMHERSWNQQGFFLAPVNPNVPFMESLAGTFELSTASMGPTNTSEWNDELLLRTTSIGVLGREVTVLKIVLPLEIREHALTALSRMNISAATLFPGLEGFARSLRLHL